MSADVLEAIREVMRERLGWSGPVREDMRLAEDLGLDSVRLLTLAAEVENRCRVMLDETDEAGIVTVGDLVAVVRKKHG